MAKDTNKVALGNGDLFLNNIEVGHLKGDVALVGEGEFVDFKPSNMTGPVKRFVTGEIWKLTASLAELKVANLRLATGVTTAATSSSSFPAYDPSSYSVPDSASYDIINFGGDKTVSEVPLRFEHQRAGSDRKVIILFYKAVSNRNLNLPFHEQEVVLQEIEFTAMADSTRDAGDQMGFVADQVHPADA